MIFDYVKNPRKQSNEQSNDSDAIQYKHDGQSESVWTCKTQM